MIQENIQKRFNNLRKTILVCLLILPGICYGGVVLDLKGIAYTNIPNVLNRYTNISIEAVVVGNPFKLFSGPLRESDGIVYDFFDAGDHFQRGTTAGFYGDLNSLQTLVNTLQKSGIALYAWVNPFIQREGYKRDFWSFSDFISTGSESPDKYIVDIRGSGKAKMDRIFSQMRSLPVQKWVVDLRVVRSDLQEDYARYAKSALGDRGLILTDAGTTDLVSSNYWRLRREAFMMPIPSLDKLDKIQIQDNGIQYIESPQPSINNTATILYLLSKHYRIFISASLLDNYHLALISMLEKGDWQKIVVAPERMILSSARGLIAIDMGETLSVWNIKNNFIKQGFYKSVLGGSWMKARKDGTEFFMFPSGVAFWDFSVK